MYLKPEIPTSYIYIGKHLNNCEYTSPGFLFKIKSNNSYYMYYIFNLIIFIQVKRGDQSAVAKYQAGLKLQITDVRRNQENTTNPGIKSGSHLNNVLGLAEANERGKMNL